MDTNSSITNQLLNYIKHLSEAAVSKLLEAAIDMFDIESSKVDVCPHCGSVHFVKNGLKCGKQRYLCHDCGKTFVTTTNTIMSGSHYPASIWKRVIECTLAGDSIDNTAEQLGLSHQCVWHMRHKFMLALQDLLDRDPILLSDVSEVDETYVLESYKGKALPSNVDRPARKHGAKAQKRGISNEYICINTGVQRNGKAMAHTVNRAKPSIDELKQVYEGHIQDNSLYICDGLTGYSVLRELADCSIQDINEAPKDGQGFFHLNTVNNFHQYIKRMYEFYRGVGTKYLNRYNALFSVAWRNGKSGVASLCEGLFHPTTVNYHHSIVDVRHFNLLMI